MLTALQTASIVTFMLLWKLFVNQSSKKENNQEDLSFPMTSEKGNLSKQKSLQRHPTQRRSSPKTVAVQETFPSTDC